MKSIGYRLGDGRDAGRTWVKAIHVLLPSPVAKVAHSGLNGTLTSVGYARQMRAVLSLIFTTQLLIACDSRPVFPIDDEDGGRATSDASTDSSAGDAQADAPGDAEADASADAAEASADAADATTD